MMVEGNLWLPLSARLWALGGVGRLSKHHAVADITDHVGLEGVISKERYS